MHREGQDVSRGVFGDRQRNLVVTQAQVERLAMGRYRVVDRGADSELAESLLESVAITLDANRVLVIDVAVSGAFAGRYEAWDPSQTLVQD
jgi:hypothetical protein